MWQMLSEHASELVGIGISTFAYLAAMLRKRTKKKCDDEAPQPRTQIERYLMERWQECLKHSIDCDEKYAEISSQIGALQVDLEKRG